MAVVLTPAVGFLRLALPDPAMIYPCFHFIRNIVWFRRLAVKPIGKSLTFPDHGCAEVWNILCSTFGEMPVIAILFEDGAGKRLARDTGIQPLGGDHSAGPGLVIMIIGKLILFAGIDTEESVGLTVSRIAEGVSINDDAMESGIDYLCS